jgi:hypothetical protein
MTVNTPANAINRIPVALDQRPAVMYEYGGRIMLRPATRREYTMNWSEIEYRWDQMKFVLATHWNKLNNEDLARINGKRDILAKVIQERNGLDAAEAERAICTFEKDVRRPGAVK